MKNFFTRPLVGYYETVTFIYSYYSLFTLVTTFKIDLYVFNYKGMFEIDYQKVIQGCVQK